MLLLAVCSVVENKRVLDGSEEIDTCSRAGWMSMSLVGQSQATVSAFRIVSR